MHEHLKRTMHVYILLVFLNRSRCIYSAALIIFYHAVHVPLQPEFGSNADPRSYVQPTGSLPGPSTCYCQYVNRFRHTGRIDPGNMKVISERSNGVNVNGGNGQLGRTRI